MDITFLGLLVTLMISGISALVIDDKTEVIGEKIDKMENQDHKLECFQQLKGIVKLSHTVVILLLFLTAFSAAIKH